MKFRILLTSVLMIFVFTFVYPSFCSDSIALYVEEKVDLNQYIKDFFESDDITWESGNKLIAEVDKNGIITGKSVGTTTIAVTEGRSLNVKTKLLDIKVVSSTKDFKINGSSIEVYPGEWQSIDYSIITFDGREIKPSNAVRWYSNNSSIAKVDSSGKVTGLVSGKATITGKTIDGNKSATIEVLVKKSTSKMTINKNAPSVKLKSGETTTLSATIDNIDVSSKISWSSDNISIASIDENGNLKALSPGKTRITGKIGTGIIRDYIDVYVSTMVKGIKFNTNSVTLKNIGDTYKMSYEIIALNPSEPPLLTTVSWYSSNDDVVSVSKTGELKALQNGVVKISALTTDGGKGAACTVRVEAETTPERQIFVTKVEFDSVPENGVFGEKIPLKYNVYPENATNKNIRISVNEGSPDQIQLIDGTYYFIPSETGSLELLIRNDSKTTDLAKIRIDPAISDLDIEINSLEYKNSKYQLYMGEEAKISYAFKMRSPYSDYNVFPAHFIAESDDETILKIKEYGGDFYVQGVRGGNAQVTVKTKDGRYSDQVSIYVKSPIKSTYTDKKVIVPLNIPYRPNFYPTIISYTDYPFETIDLTDFYKVIITDQYISEKYIDQEIEFEKSLAANQFSTREDRLNSLISIKKTASGGYCKFLESRNLTDRSGNIIRIAEVIDGNKIVGKFDGKVNIELKSSYSNLDKKSVIEFTSDKTLFSVTTNDAKFTTYDSIFKALGYNSLIGAKSPAANIELAIKCQSRFIGKLEKDIPSETYVNDIINLEALGIIPEKMKENYRNYITREELAELSVKLYEYYSKKEVLEKHDFRFLDTKSIAINNSARLGLMEPVKRDYFYPAASAKKSEFYSVIDKVVYLTGTKALDASAVKNDLNSGDPLTIEEAIGFLGNAIK